MAMESLIKGRFDAAGAIGTGPEVERDGSKRLANKKRAIIDSRDVLQVSVRLMSVTLQIETPIERSASRASYIDSDPPVRRLERRA